MVARIFVVARVFMVARVFAAGKEFQRFQSNTLLYSTLAIDKPLACKLGIQPVMVPLKP